MGVISIDNLKSQRAVYVDFTGTSGVGDAHNIFLEADDNPTIREFCRRVLTGGRGERVRGFEYDARTNTFRLESD